LNRQAISPTKSGKYFLRMPPMQESFRLRIPPKAFDMIRMDLATHQFAAIMVDVFMAPAMLRQHAVHLESIGVDEGMGCDTFPQQKENESDIKFLWLNDDKSFARSTVKEADDRQFVGAVPFLGFDPPDMQTLVFALAADVRLVELDGSLKDRKGIGSHTNTKMVQHVQDAASRNARFRA
jgi:hypothetical protein